MYDDSVIVMKSLLLLLHVFLTYIYIDSCESLKNICLSNVEITIHQDIKLLLFLLSLVVSQ